jgi:hypothetical protein
MWSLADLQVGAVAVLVADDADVAGVEARRARPRGPERRCAEKLFSCPYLFV